MSSVHPDQQRGDVPNVMGCSPEKQFQAGRGPPPTRTRMGSRPMLVMNTCAAGKVYTMPSVKMTVHSCMFWRTRAHEHEQPRQFRFLLLAHRARVLHIDLCMLAANLLVHYSDVAAVVPEATGGRATGTARVQLRAAPRGRRCRTTATTAATSCCHPALAACSSDVYGAGSEPCLRGRAPPEAVASP